MFHPAAGEAGSDRPADERLPGLRKSARGGRGIAHPRRRGALQAREQDARAGEKRHRQRRQEDGAALSVPVAAPA